MRLQRCESSQSVYVAIPLSYPLFVSQQQGLLLQLLRLAAKYRVQQSLNSPTKPVALRRARSFDMNSTQPGFDSGATSVAASHSRRMIVHGVERLREARSRFLERQLLLPRSVEPRLMWCVETEVRFKLRLQRFCHSFVPLLRYR